MLPRDYKFRFLFIGLFFLFSFSLTLNASVSLNDYPQIKSSWDDGALTSAIAQLKEEAKKRPGNDEIVELLKKITFQKNKFDEWIDEATLLLKQQKFKEAKEKLAFVSTINPNYTPYRNLINKIKTTEEELQYPSKVIFDGESLGDSWKIYEAHGGNYKKHGQFQNNEFMVNVPKGNGWGKVGIASTKAMIDFTETNQSLSYRLKFDFDVKNTTDFVINLKDIDSWRSIGVVYRHLDDNKSAMVELWKDGKLNMQLAMSNTAPKFLDLVIQPNNFVYLQLPDGRYLQTTSLKYTLAEKGYNLEVYSQAVKKDLQVKMALKSIILKKVSFKKYLDNREKRDKTILFDGKFLDAKWVPHGAHGGSFTKHATLKDHKLIVDVPKGNKWGKVGILSPNSLVWLDDFGKGAEAQVTFEFDSNRTDGFMLALVKSSYRGNDPGNPKVAFLWNTITDRNQSVMKLLLDNKEVWKEELNTTTSPSYVTLKLEEGNITVSGDTFSAKSTEWHGIRANCGFRVWAYSHAYVSNEPVKMTLKQIVLTKKAGKSDDFAPTKDVAPLVVKQLFNGKDDKQWEAVGAAGGNFEKFGHFENGKMLVDVPKKNGWGKTGILSKEKFLKFNRRLENIPYKVTLKVDPDKTTGFVMAFSGRRVADMWSNHRIWISLIQSSDGSYYLYLRGSNHHYWGRTINPEIMKSWDGTLEILFENKRTKVCVGGVCVAGPVGYGAFSSAYTTILSHPAKEYGASKLTLEKVTGQWIAPDGMSTLDRWQFVDDENFDPDEFLMELKEEK